ncbi:hypothetical protein HanPSC8_Chr09g0386261 [Helianthus annuus]|nr:hypothetical protein HanPSC8_Chr09g0386261 [Helianthus annuus]
MRFSGSKQHEKLVNSSLLTALDSHLVKAVSHSLLGRLVMRFSGSKQHEKLVNSSLLTALDSHLVKAVSHSLLGVRQRALYR